MLDFIYRILFTCRKELLAILKDPSGRVILISPVIIQSFLFGYAATFDLADVPYAVVDQSHSASSTELLARLDGTGVFHRVATLQTLKEAQQMIDGGKVLLVIQFDQQFEPLLESGQTAAMQVLLDARNSNTAGSAVFYISNIVAEFNRRYGASQALTIEARAWYNPNLETRWTIMPGMIVSLSMLQTLLLTALSVAREREQGTFDQLLVTPLTPLEMMIAKALPPMAVGLVQSTIVLGICIYWFHIPFMGHFSAFYLGLSLFILACVGVGLAISALSLTMQQGMLYAFMFVMPMMMLSGLATPVKNMPMMMQELTRLNPLRYGMDLTRRIYLEGASLSQVSYDLYPLLLIVIVTLPAAAWLFRNRLA